MALSAISPNRVFFSGVVVGDQVKDMASPLSPPTQRGRNLTGMKYNIWTYSLIVEINSDLLHKEASVS